MSKTITFCFTSEKAKELYGNLPPQYETPFASGFDLRAVDFACKKYIDRNGYDCNFDVCNFSNEVVGYKRENILILDSKCRVLVKTGIRISMPIIQNEIMELQIRSRSGLSRDNGASVLNGIGTIDNDYTGELGVILHNAGNKAFTVNIGDRIAQGVFNPLQQCVWQEVSEEEFEKSFCNTKRGNNGFGSTGK
jgi:dUTP pyrophosphatase